MSSNFTHKQLAVNCFNKVWDLLEKSERTESEAEEMVHLCHIVLAMDPSRESYATKHIGWILAAFTCLFSDRQWGTSTVLC
jgi:hypothetical protein